MTPATPAEPTPAPLGRVLLFDDDYACIPGFTALLERAGFDAVGCWDIAVAETLALDGGFDACLIDIVAPSGPLGHDLISRLRANPRTAELSILATSGYGGEYLEKALQLGADAAIEKYDINGRIIPLLARLCRDRRADARILVVEDDEGCAELAEETLLHAPTPYAVRVCASFRQAAKELAAWRPHLVLLDLHLPDGDGFTFLGELPGLRAAGDFGVIVVSADPRAELGPLSLEQGADDFIAKPIDRDDLLARVGALLRRLRPRAAAPPPAWGPLAFDWESRAATLRGRPAGLTRTEFDILESLVKAEGGLVRTRALLAGILGVEDDARLKGGRKALCVHVANLRRKLGRDLVLNLRGVGYLLARRPGV